MKLSEAFIQQIVADLVVLALGGYNRLLCAVGEAFPAKCARGLRTLHTPGAGGFGLGAVWAMSGHTVLVFVVHFCWACMFGPLPAALIMPSKRGLLYSVRRSRLLLAVLVVLMNGGSWSSPFGQRANSIFAGFELQLRASDSLRHPATCHPTVTPFDTACRQRL
jgi:hypothetical protein